MLMKAYEDPRFAETYIPIADSIFSYELNVSNTEAYLLVFEDKFKTGGFRLIKIFPDNGTIKLTLYPMEEFDKNTIKGGRLNKQFKKFNTKFENTFAERITPLHDRLHVLFKNKNYYSDMM